MELYVKAQLKFWAESDWDNQCYTTQHVIHLSNLGTFSCHSLWELIMLTIHDSTEDQQDYILLCRKF